MTHTSTGADTATEWRFSSHSGGGDCVHARRTSGGVEVRDSKNPAVGLPVTRADWVRLLESLRGRR
jgi:hypothetical protein